MHDEYVAAQRRIKVEVCANMSRILGSALSTWQRETRHAIELAEKSAMPGWQYHVHRLLADESLATDWLAEVNKAHSYILQHEASNGNG